MIKFILMLLIILLPVLPVMAQQKLLTPEYGLKRDLPAAPAQDTLESVTDKIKPEIKQDIERVIIEPITPPEQKEEKEPEKVVAPDKVIKILPSKEFIDSEDNQSEKKLRSLNDIDIVRGLVFGISKQSVKDFEDILPVAEEENGIIYVDQMWGFDSSIGYEFLNDSLWRVQIVNEKKYFHPKNRITDLGAIQAELERKFGRPTSEDFIWLNDVEKDFPQFWGWAVYRKELIIRIIWEFEDVQIKLIAEAPVRSMPEIRVEFISKKYRPIKKDLNIIRF